MSSADCKASRPSLVQHVRRSQRRVYKQFGIDHFRRQVRRGLAVTNPTRFTPVASLFSFPLQGIWLTVHRLQFEFKDHLPLAIWVRTCKGDKSNTINVFVNIQASVRVRLLPEEAHCA